MSFGRRTIVNTARRTEAMRSQARRRQDISSEDFERPCRPGRLALLKPIVFHTRNYRLEGSASGGRGLSESDGNEELPWHSPLIQRRARVPRHGRARLTIGLHFPYRRLILCVANDARASTIGGRLGIGNLRYLFEEYAFDTATARAASRGGRRLRRATGIRPSRLPIRNREPCRQQRRPHQRHLEWAQRVRCGADNAPECRPERDRRFR